MSQEQNARHVKKARERVADHATIPLDANARRAKVKRDLEHLTAQLGRMMQKAGELSKEFDALS